MARRLVFIGDSITDCDRRLDARGLGFGYVDIVADELAARGEDAVVLNRGVAGDRVGCLKDRWQVDVLDEHPDVLTVFVGVNDTLWTFYQGWPTAPDDFERDLDDILGRTGGARLIVVDPFLLDVPGEQFRWGLGTEFTRRDLDRKRPIVTRLAAEHGAVFVPLQDAMSAAADERGAPVVAGDGVHPTTLGHRLLARLWLDAYDAAR
jgi:lysophospholipase L1-like esterase